MSQALNNFEQLLEEEAIAFDGQKRQQARDDIINTLSSYQLVGQLVTVFVPDMINVLIAASGGGQAVAADGEERPIRQEHPPHLNGKPTDRGPNLTKDDLDDIR